MENLKQFIELLVGCILWAFLFLTFSLKKFIKGGKRYFISSCQIQAVCNTQPLMFVQKAKVDHSFVQEKKISRAPCKKNGGF